MIDKIAQAMLFIIAVLLFISFLVFWFVLAIDFLKTVT